MRRSLPFVLSFLAAGLAADAQAPAPYRFDPATKVFRVDARAVTYAFGVNERGELQSLFWGARLGDADALPMAKSAPEAASFDGSTLTTPQEFAGWGAGLTTEPALKITFPNGNRDLVLHYVGEHIAADGLTVTLKDIAEAVFVDLHYAIDAETGVLARSALIRNETGGPIVVEQAAAANLTLPLVEHPWLTTLSGRWGGEFTPSSRELVPGKAVIESRRGSTGHQNSPWFAIERAHTGEGEHGDVWFGALAWSGSWQIAVEGDALRRTRVTAGFNPFDFGYKLERGERLQTPVLYAGFTSDGMGGAARLLHRFELARILPHAPGAELPRLRPVLYNSWEATEFAVDEPGQTRLAEKAARLGVERFVMDDGWFGARKNDHAGLGDWTVNPQKFPHGLGPLIDRVQALGMDFGLWVEPEMVNPDSDLYRAHPDWVLNFPGRPRTEARNQLVLNLARPDVRRYVFGFLDKLLNENKIAFLKWDYNRNWTEPGWPAVAPDSEKKVYVAYTEALYGILRDLRAKHPGVEIESCSGGGGRVDLGIMALTEEVWTSDNTDPFDRLAIQDGFTHAYTPGVMMAWVTDSPSWLNNRATTLTYRFLSSMQGSLGIGANLDKWAEADFATAKRLVGEYKAIRETVQHGDRYRLLAPGAGGETWVTESVARDRTQAVVFAFGNASHEGYPFPVVRPLGLDPARRYRLRRFDTPDAGQPSTIGSGAYWMAVGWTPALRGDLQAAGYTLTAE